jgi:tetratricopeptide (TPR) repeat protein
MLESGGPDGDSRPSAGDPRRALAEVVAAVLEPGESADQAVERLACGIVEWRIGTEVLAPWLQDLERVADRGRPWLRLLTALGLFWVRGDPAGTDRATSAWRSFSRGKDATGRLYAALAMAEMCMARSEWDDVVTWFDRAAEVTRSGVILSPAATAVLAERFYSSGRLEDAGLLADEGVARALIEADPSGEAGARFLKAFILKDQGALEAAEEHLGVAARLFEDLATSEAARGLARCRAAQAIIAAYRQEYQVASTLFDEAIERARCMGSDVLLVTFLSTRAELMGDADPGGAYRDAREARRLAARLGSTLALSWALRGLGVAARAVGDTTVSRMVLDEVLRMPLRPIERGRTQLALAETLIAVGDREAAREVLFRTLAIFAPAGAAYWQARTYATLSRAEPARGAVYLARARTLGTDIAFARLLPVGSLEVQVLGIPSVKVAGRPVTFRTAHERKLVFSLAMAAPDGLSQRDLAERIWPRKPGALGDLRKALNRARQALYPEGYRIGRVDRSILFLDLAGARFDWAECLLLATRALHPAARENGAPLAAEALSRLRHPLLPAWADEAWVADHEGRRRQVVANLENLVGD